MLLRCLCVGTKAQLAAERGKGSGGLESSRAKRGVGVLQASSREQSRGGHPGSPPACTKQKEERGLSAWSCVDPEESHSLRAAGRFIHVPFIKAKPQQQS